MRTCIVTSDFHVPGETFINRHIQHAFGGDTCVLTGRFNGADPFGKPLFVRRAPLGMADKLRAPFAMGWNAAVEGTGRLPFGRNRQRLADWLRDQHVQVILAEFGTQALVVAKLGAALDIPVFTYFRGTDASFALRSRQIVRAYRRMMPRLAGVFSVSQFLLDNLAAHGVTHPNAHVVPSGVDIRRFAPRAKTPGTFLAVGRMVEKKAPQVTLRAFATAARGRDAHLTFIGDGPLLDTCRTMAATLGVTDQVTFAGALPHDAVRQRLEITETFLQHSVTAQNGNTEGLPTAIQEALACGCITLSTIHAGIPEAVEHGVNGLLVPEWDEQGFAARIAQVLDMSDRSAMTRAARATAEAKFDNAVLLQKMERIMREAPTPRP
ncbi:glycosyl transferase family 1 [Salipiger aestuarii]|uniref:Glycosyltransferase involved in cell wall biosynthesis n=1 Tax=Salipiger aestuarii TaxID=568098 RepID=A0A327YIZ0_9RHOB|nr:glycosyltransferase [Salipiger aestuarii]EIE52300.1 glycosyl transferase, group 1 [Citreicella sp. 357]KAA8609048.1 glycosyl transferase family 1 [Salipiger aestuarii]KAB2542740.1 glycosyl transferase family 1 [Salipiger aestuarii]RAK20322.1 glycosyltransferase involved in cell wall biosynthesis [Salipiger aestuarii]